MTRNVGIGRVRLGDQDARRGGGERGIDAGHRGRRLVGDRESEIVAAVGINAVTAITGSNRGTDGGSGNSGQREHNTIAGAADVADGNGISTRLKSGAFRVAGENAGDGIVAVIVDDGELLTERHRRGESQT